ncbi:MAG: protein-export chaperone SecB [Fusobacterium sp.]|uniref:protein-export chaperone SecB n=1 Tax=Fusobacterium sp. TaxID=68766 RepID=UPI003991CD29
MRENDKTKLIFNNYIITKLNYDINKEFDNTQTVPLKMGITPNFREFEDPKSIEVTIDFKLFENSKEYPFYLELSITGFFEIEGEVENEQAKFYKEVNTVTILFPYLRAAISSITSLMNINPVILPPINVIELMKSNKKNPQ